ncbi:MAG: MFS transporter [Aestuariivita sp.]|nr:MFS transporter [Aestuariivita sp.]
MPFQIYLSSFLVDDNGLSVEQSASAWRLIGFVGMFGGFLMGWVADRITVRWTLLVVYLFLSFSTGLLLFFEINTVIVFTAVALFGLSFYAIFGLVPAYISHVYKNNTAALAFSFGNVTLGLGGIFGNVIGGWLKQQMGTFDGIYTIILVAAAGSAIVCVIMRSEEHTLSQNELGSRNR